MTRPRGRQLERVPEVLDAQSEARAYPLDVPAPNGTGQPVVIYMQPPPAQVESTPEPSIRWDRLACYVAGLVMLAVVIVLLMASGALDLRASGPELQPVRERPVDLVGPSR